MVFIVQLPIVPVEKEINSVVEILDELPSGIPKGIQVFRGDRKFYTPFNDGNNIIEIVRDLVPSDFYISLHAPFASKAMIPFYRLDNDQSVKMLHENFDLAERINAKNLIVHAGTVFYHPRAIIPDGFEPYRWKGLSSEERGRITFNVCKNICDVARQYPDIDVHVENIPAPINSDTSNPKNCFIDPLLNSYEWIQNFFRTLHLNFSGVKNVGLCFDTNHYLRTILTLNTPWNYNSNAEFCEALSGVARDGVDSLLTEFDDKELWWVGEQLVDTIRSVQVSDTIAWSIGGPRTDSLSLRRGNNWADIKEFLKVIKEYNAKNDRSVPLSFDIDEEDYVSRPLQRESLELFLEEVGT